MGAPINEAKLNEMMGKVVGDLGAMVGSTCVVIGDKLGLYKAMANGLPVGSQELADRTSTNERYIREWLVNQAAGGYIDFNAANQTYHLNPEQVATLADESSPYFVCGGFQALWAMTAAQERISEGFRTGKGMLWGEHHQCLFDGTRRFFKPGYAAHLVQNWIPSLEGVDAVLRAGGVVADIGCGHGASTIIMALAYPESTFRGFDNHEASIHEAHRAADAAGVQDRVKFDVAPADRFPGENYDLITFFDCFHDLGNPSGAARRACESLASDGAVMIVEPMAGNTIQENLNPLGRTFSGASVLCCTPNALAYGGHALGTLATDAAIAEMVHKGGLKRFRRATETPFNRVFEAKR